jgi:serine/threonine-protein kinase
VLKSALTSNIHDAGLAKRFWHEVQAAREVRHPNIIAIREFGVTDDEKIPYLVMEFFDGKPLKHYAVNPGLLNYTQKIHVLRQVADALCAIHAKGITHRDIKPHNILVNEQLLVKITDFGIARIPDSDLTASTELMGSPAYLAPEAFERSNVDARADIFSLGVVAYELFLGKRPFEADTIPRFAWLVQHERPVAPGEIDPVFPKPLQAMIARMLKKDLPSRYATAQEIVADFDRYLAGQQLSLPVGQVRRGGLARDWH